MTEKRTTKRATKTAVVTKLDELEPVGVVEQVAAAPEASLDIYDLINRAGARAVTQEETNFVTATRNRFNAGEDIIGFDVQWLEDLAAR